MPPLPPLRDPIPVVWDGLWLNTGDQTNGLCAVVTNIEGWLDSPPLDGNDVARVISDGAAWGPKVLRQRTVIVSGTAAGPRDELGRFRDQLATRAAAREPALFAVGDWDLQRVLTADVRAGTEQFRVHWLGDVGVPLAGQPYRRGPCPVSGHLADRGADQHHRGHRPGLPEGLPLAPRRDDPQRGDPAEHGEPPGPGVCGLQRGPV